MGGGEGWGHWPVWGLLRFLAGTTWTTPKKKLQHFTTSIPSGLQRSEGDTAKVSTPPTIVNEPTSERPHRSSPLLPHFPYSLFCGLYLTEGSTGRFYHPAHPLPTPTWIVPPEVFTGRLTGCSAHQGIKVSSPSICAVVRRDLFNSNRVNITDACKAGITVEELDDLRRGSGSVS